MRISGIKFSGITTGIDTSNIVQKLVALEEGRTALSQVAGPAAAVQAAAGALSASQAGSGLAGLSGAAGTGASTQ